MSVEKSFVESLNDSLERDIKLKNNSNILTTLNEILALEMTTSLLTASNIARTVGKLRRYDNVDIARIATKIITSWKLISTASTNNSNSSSLSPSTPLMSLERFLTSNNSLTALPAMVFDDNVAIDPTRSRILRNGVTNEKLPNVVYWMSRDQRINDNWALLHAQDIAIKNGGSLAIVFCLSTNFPSANIRSFGFMLRGLKELEQHSNAHNIRFKILIGSPKDVIPTFCLDHSVGTVVTDFSPLAISKTWKTQLISSLNDIERTTKGKSIFLIEVDTHNIAPCFIVSNKCEFAAKTIRTKIHNAMTRYLTEYPSLKVHPTAFDDNTNSNSTTISSKKRKLSTEEPANNWDAVADAMQTVDRNVEEISWILSGENAAIAAMKQFIPRLSTYANTRNDPSIVGGVSNLSPYFHFGQLSAQRVLLEIKRAFKCGTGALFPSGERTSGIHSFCEEAVVRKELSDNFCFYNDNYDRFEGAHEWAQTTLRQHWTDKRSVLYTCEELETAKTYDKLWNAAQLEMVHTGKMHGFMRMYWAKKILEWSPDPSEALRRAIYLNDKFSIDGRDPNGFVGCMWAICGVHDRAWGRRPVFGTIRFMNYEGCKRKFDILKYIGHCENLAACSLKNDDSKNKEVY